MSLFVLQIHESVQNGCGYNMSAGIIAGIATGIATGIGIGKYILFPVIDMTLDVSTTSG